LHQFISGIITNKGGISLAVGGWNALVHVLFGLPVTTNISDFMSVIKANSSRWINEQKYVKGKFQWQTGIFFSQKSKRY
jgi:putative transposase